MKNLVEELRGKIKSIETHNVTFVGIDESGEVHAISEYDLPADFDEAVKASITPYEKLKETAFNQFNRCPLNELKEEAKKLMDRFEDGAGIVFNILLDYLESKMTEEEYIDFCESL